MKRIAFLLVAFFPAWCFGQCDSWINNSVEKAKELIPVYEKFLNTRFNIDVVYSPRLVIRDSSNRWSVIILSKSPENVSNITIEGEPKAIQALFDNYFLPIAQKCPDYKSQGQWLSFGSTMIVWRSEKFDKYRTINIEKAR